MFLQGPIPEVLMPPGVDLAQLGEIGLRILGLPENDAREFAKKVDWHTTLVVPVPPMATRFRQVIVGGSQGVDPGWWRQARWSSIRMVGWSSRSATSLPPTR